MAIEGEDPVWIVAGLFGAGVQYTGTREGAEEHLNKLAGHIQTLFENSGIKYMRSKGTVRLKVLTEGSNDNGHVDVEDDEQVDLDTLMGGDTE